MWSGRLFAAIYTVIAILPLLGNGWDGALWRSAIGWLFVAAAVFYATTRMKEGSIVAAVLLFAMFILAKLALSRLTGQPLWSGALWTILLGGGLANGVWGSFALASARHDAESVPPAPLREKR